jgi:hypothetical protein
MSPDIPLRFVYDPPYPPGVGTVWGFKQLIAPGGGEALMRRTAPAPRGEWRVYGPAAQDFPVLAAGHYRDDAIDAFAEIAWWRIVITLRRSQLEGPATGLAWVWFALSAVHGAWLVTHEQWRQTMQHAAVRAALDGDEDTKLETVLAALDGWVSVVIVEDVAPARPLRNLTVAS